MLGNRSAALLIAVLLVLLIAACGQDGAPNGGGNPEGGRASLPSPPLGAALDYSKPFHKQASVNYTIGTTGPADSSGFELVSGKGWTLMPSLSEMEPLAWARYEWMVVPYYTVQGIRIHLRNYSTNPGSYFVGIANYDTNTWFWQPLPDSDGTTFEDQAIVNLDLPTEGFNPYSPDGKAHVVVVSHEQELSIAHVLLKIDEAVPPPAKFEATHGTVLGGVQLTWLPLNWTYPDLFADGILIERASADTDYEFEVLTTVEGHKDSYFDTATVPGGRYLYRARTIVNGVPGPRYALNDTAMAGLRPTAVMQVSGTAPDLQLYAGDSYDGDVTDSIIKYIWKTSISSNPNYFYTFEREEGDTFTFTLSDMTAVNRFELQVEDNEGHLSLPASDFHDAAGFFLWSPNLGCVQDNSGQPDPKDTIQGDGPGSYGVMLHFELGCGAPNYQIELDTNFDGSFEATDGVPVVVLKSFATAPNVDGPYSMFANIPAAQPNGEYYFAVRVTNGNGDESVYMWPDKVTLAP